MFKIHAKIALPPHFTFSLFPQRKFSERIFQLFYPGFWIVFNIETRWRKRRNYLYSSHDTDLNRFYFKHITLDDLLFANLLFDLERRGTPNWIRRDSIAFAGLSRQKITPRTQKYIQRSIRHLTKKTCAAQIFIWYQNEYAHRMLKKSWQLWNCEEVNWTFFILQTQFMDTPIKMNSKNWKFKLIYLNEKKGAASLAVESPSLI